MTILNVEDERKLIIKDDNVDLFFVSLINQVVHVKLKITKMSKLFIKTLIKLQNKKIIKTSIKNRIIILFFKLLLKTKLEKLQSKSCYVTFFLNEINDKYKNHLNKYL